MHSRRNLYKALFIPGALLVAGPVSQAQDRAADPGPTSQTATVQSSAVEAEPLGKVFFGRFRRLGDLTNASIQKYFETHPRQVSAFQDYVYRLVRDGLIHESRASEMSGSAVKGSKLAATEPDSSVADKPRKQADVLSQEVRRRETVQLDSVQQAVTSKDAPRKEKAPAQERTPSEQRQTQYYFDVVNALDPHVPEMSQVESRAYRETRAVAVQLGLRLPLDLLRNQKPALSAGFAKGFSSVDSFFTDAFTTYFERHPDEIWAARNYFQQLIDLELLRHERGLVLVTTAFEAAERGSQWSEYREQILVEANKETSDPAQRPEQAVDVAELPAGVIPEVVGSYVDSPNNADVIEFGAVPELPGGPERQPNAAEAAIKALEEQERRKKLARTAAKIMRVFAQNKVPRAEIGQRVAEIFKEEAAKETSETVTREAQEVVDNVFDNGSISVKVGEGATTYRVEGLKSFEASPDDPIYSFGQVGAANEGDETTVNIGVGIRALDPSGMLLFGGNAFYDRALNEGHARLGVGVEVISAPFTGSMNRYYALSGGKQISTDLTERALDGRDAKFRGAMPYLPGLFAEYTDFKWYGADGGSDLYGQKYGLSGKLSENLSVQVGRTKYGSGQSGTNSAMLTYNYSDRPGRSPRLFELSPYPWQWTPISPTQRYQLVERETEVVTQQTSASTLSITFSSI